MRIALMTALICIFLVDTVAAQDRTVPLDLVLGLFAFQMPGDTVSNTRILVGKAPDDLRLPKLNLPVIGALVHEEGAMIVYRVTGDLKKVHIVANEQMRTAGWQPMRVPDFPAPDAGFIGSEL